MRVVIRDIKRDEQGVASTVGTIMALLVFLTFLSLIVNQYVPVWMKDSEAAHMNSALGQFGGLKGTIDLQVLAAQMAASIGEHYEPVEAATPITLGLDGVPIFAAPSIGELSLKPDDGVWTVAAFYDIRGVRTKVEETSRGAVELNVGNRYFIPQSVAYENGAVIKYQQDGQVIRASPVFNPVRANNKLNLTFQLVSLYGGGAVTGTSTEIVTSRLFGVDRQAYSDLASTIWLNHTSKYGLAWYNFMNATLAKSVGITSGTFLVSPSPTQILSRTFTGIVSGIPVYRIQASYSSQTGLYTLTVEIYDTVVMPLERFTVQRAYVTIGIGESTEELPI